MTRDAYKQQYDLFKEHMGGDQTASRAANALMRGGYATIEQLLSATHEELASLRTVGPAAALRIGELRGSLRPGLRGTVSQTGDVLGDIYENISRMVAADEHGIVSCSLRGPREGLPPEIHVTVKGFDRRATLVLTATEISHDSHTRVDLCIPCGRHGKCPRPADCAHGGCAAADELTRLGREMEEKHRPVLVRYGSRHSVPAEVCGTCSDIESGFLVPVTSCEESKAQMDDIPGSQYAEVYGVLRPDEEENGGDP